MEYILAAKKDVSIVTIDGGVLDLKTGDTIAIVKTQGEPRSVMTMIAHGTADLFKVEAEEQVIEEQRADKQSIEQPAASAQPLTDATGLEEFDEDVLGSLAKQQVHTIADAVEYHEEHGSFEPLKHIGRATNRRLIELIEQFKAAEDT